MTNRISNLVIVAAVVLLLLLPGPGIALAQSTVAAGDPFAALDAHLNETAADTLERVLQPPPVSTVAPLQELAQSQVAGISPGAARASLQRVARLRPIVDPILRQAGVPTGLAAVVLVESGGDPEALSPKGARGLWQLMPGTARRYGLVVNESRDDRLDVLRSTRAAAEYLRDLYRQFRDWPLALAAYNAGERAVQRAVSRTGSARFSVAAGRLPAETQNYVPAVLRAMTRFGSDTTLPSAASVRPTAVVYAGAE